MEFSELVRSRYSVRTYKSDPVDEKHLQQILTAAQMAPTAANRQPFQIIIIHTRGRENELKRIYARDWFTQAPLLICICATPQTGWVRKDGKNYAEVDAAIVMDHLILSAADLGYGTCWVAAFDAGAARQILQLPDEIEPIAFTPLGLPADTPREKKRQPLTSLIRHERW